MYIFFALLVALLVYMPISGGLRSRQGGGAHQLAVASSFVLLVALVIFNFSSRAVGVDLGPMHAVSYDIPGDYIAAGAAGLLALTPLALACLSPLLALRLLRLRR